MSLAGGAEQISLLRTAIARIEAGAQAGQATSGIAVSLVQRRSAFFELAPAAPVDRGAATGFAMALAARFARAQNGPVLWIAEDFALSEWGVPYGPGLAAYGLGWRDFTLMRRRLPQSCAQARHGRAGGGRPSHFVAPARQ